MLGLFTEIYWSLDEVILELYWRVLYTSFKVVSNNYYFSITVGKVTTVIAHQRNILEIQKPEQVLSK
jgi:hypothetical protein